MSGCFGLAGDPFERANPDRVQETRPTLRAFDLYQQGALAPGAQSEVKIGDTSYPLAIAEPGKLTVNGLAIEIRPHPVCVVCFGCPVCGADRYKLYLKDGRWGCPKCHGLDRASRHRHSGVRHLYKLAQLRRRIGASPEPFTLIEPRSLRARKFWRDVMQIRRIEASLAGLVADNARVIERRYAANRRRRGPRPGDL
jgi:hypothetical protein